MSLILAGALAVAAIAPAGMIAGAATTNDTVTIQIHENATIGPWASGSFTGECPSTHPYLSGNEYTPGRISPNGTIYTASTLVGASAFIGDFSQRDEGGRTMRAVKGIWGTYTNWDVIPGHITISLECTSDWDAAKYDVTK